jgi:hypothetical protein
MAFDANRTLDRRVFLATSSTTLAGVNVTANGVPVAFDERRRNGLGRYLTAEQLAPQGERRLSDVLMSVPSVNIVRGRGNNGWVLGKRAPQHIKPTGMEYVNTKAGDGTQKMCGGDALNPCRWTDADLVEQGIYCPNAGEAKQGIECACYAQVYVDNRLMNGSRPTEPFDVNTIPTKDVVGLEFYASAAQTPGQYSNLLARCGVMLIWTRR